MRIFLFFIGALSIFFPSLSLAQVALGESWPQLIECLQKDGINKVGDLDLNEFVNEPKSGKISWKYLKRDAPSVLTGARTSAVYIFNAQTQEHQIYVNPNITKEALEFMPELETHERFGVLGYKDQHYNLTSSLSLLCDTQNPDDRKRMIKSFSNGLFKKENLREEGGSSVGGGGDIRALLIKKQILAEIIKDEGQVTLEFLTAYQGINFEPIASDEINYVSLHYEYRNAVSIERLGPLPRVPLINGYQEIISIWVPMHAWESSASEKKRINKDIREKILGLFPASPKKKAVRMIPLCNGKYKMPFPYSNDSDVVYLQYSRGNAIKNCNTVDGQQSMSITTPGLPEEAIPFEPGKYYYDCRWKLGKGEYRQLVSIDAGRSNLFTFQTGLEENLTAWVNILFDEMGDAKRAQMFFVRDDEDLTKSKRLQKDLKTPTDSISMPYKGQPLSFSCKKRN